MTNYFAVGFITLKILANSINTITSTDILPTSVNSNISCYQCGTLLPLNPDNLYNAIPIDLKNSPLCNSKNTTIKQVDKNKYSCALNIVLTEDTKYKYPSLENSTIYHFTALKKTYCKLSPKVICLHSTCRLVSVCCDYNLCNTVENFKLKLLALYSDAKNSNLRNNYAKYSNKTCKVNLKKKTVAKNQPCLVVTNIPTEEIMLYENNIRAINTNYTTTNKTNITTETNNTNIPTEEIMLYENNTRAINTNYTTTNKMNITTETNNSVMHFIQIHYLNFLLTYFILFN